MNTKVAILTRFCFIPVVRKWINFRLKASTPASTLSIQFANEKDKTPSNFLLFIPDQENLTMGFDYALLGVLFFEVSLLSNNVTSIGILRSSQ